MEKNIPKPKTSPKSFSSAEIKVKARHIFLSVVALLVTIIVLLGGAILLRDPNVPEGLLVIIAIIWGAGGVALMYAVSNYLTEQLPEKWTLRLQPFVFVGPALLLLAWFLAIPTLRTLYLSFMDANGFHYVGFINYVYAFTNQIMVEAFRNNLLWLVFGTSLSVGFGLLIAVLADRSRFESIFKSLIFMPMAISFVGAGVIWKFIYAYKGTGSGIQEIGLLNAIVVEYPITVNY